MEFEWDEEKERRTIRGNIDVTKAPSREQLAMLERAAEIPIPADAECPELSEDELKGLMVRKAGKWGPRYADGRAH